MTQDTLHLQSIVLRRNHNVLQVKHISSNLDY